MSVGAALCKAREEKELSLKQISEATNIQPWVLEAMEADRLHEHMSPIYVKSLLRSYARFLQLDTYTLLEHFSVEEKPKEATVIETAAPVVLARPEVEIPWPLIGLVSKMVATAAVVVGVVVWNPLRYFSNSLLSSPVHQASVTPMANSFPVDFKSVPVTPEQRLELSLVAKRRTWIQLRADGKLLVQQWVIGGAQEQWTAGKRFELVVAKPGQVDLSLNGSSINAFVMAHGGRVVISHEGITALPESAL